MKNNKLIAEFMGGQKVLSDKDIYNMPTHDNLCYQLKELQYHQSWDWLMPVIIKMADIREDTHYKLYKTIDEAYEGVVEFINQLNK